MTTLIQMGMFKRVSLFDYQAMCKTNFHSVSSARPLLSVSSGPSGLICISNKNAVTFALNFIFHALFAVILRFGFDLQVVPL
ncbi:hypothetical protein XENOCAPTIV_025249 [Xenoophorus captivus]|uniref:Uncharacterized protein n=1 Tax=Xenoophorus captivus TaxID=1517983 RepID=A0ABV0QJZ3_9TELE